MKNILNQKGSSLVEIMVGFAIISITFTMLIASINSFSSILLDSTDNKNKLNNLISAANEFNLNQNNIELAQTSDSINFTLNGENLSLPIQIKTYTIKSQPQKKLITFSKRVGN